MAVPPPPFPMKPEGDKTEKFGQGPEMLREPWLYHFVEKEEKQQIIRWMHQEGLERPRPFDERIQHAQYLKKIGNDWYNKEDYRRALHCSLSAIHCLDFCPYEQQCQSEEQRRQVAEAMLPVLCNFTQIFLKRGDWENADKAATSGLLCADKLPAEETSALRAKLFYRRALARAETGPQRDYEKSHSDLLEASKLDPSNQEVRRCLKNCKDLERNERHDAYLKGPRFAPRPKSQDEDAVQENNQSNDEHPAELSPRLEFFAMCIGKSLGRARRCWLEARSVIRQSKARLVKQQWIVTLSLLCLVIAGARHMYITIDGYSMSRVIMLGCILIAVVFLLNVLGIQLLGMDNVNFKDRDV